MVWRTLGLGDNDRRRIRLKVLAGWVTGYLVEIPVVTKETDESSGSASDSQVEDIEAHGCRLYYGATYALHHHVKVLHSVLLNVDKSTWWLPVTLPYSDRGFAKLCIL